jgi:hypothetical protein
VCRTPDLFAAPLEANPVRFVSLVDCGQSIPVSGVLC